MFLSAFEKRLDNADMVTVILKKILKLSIVADFAGRLRSGFSF